MHLYVVLTVLLAQTFPVGVVALKHHQDANSSSHRAVSGHRSPLLQLDINRESGRLKASAAGDATNSSRYHPQLLQTHANASQKKAETSLGLSAHLDSTSTGHQVSKETFNPLEHAQDHVLTSTWKSLVSAVTLRLRGNGDILDSPLVKPDLLHPQPTNRRPRQQQSSPVDNGMHDARMVKPSEVHDVVITATFIMVAFVYAVGWAVMIFTKLNPGPESQKAYIDQDDSVGAPDTDDDLEEPNGTTSASRSAPMSSSSPRTSPRGGLSRKDSGIRQTDLLFRQSSMYKRSGHITVNGDDLVNNVGISAMAIMAADEPSSVTKLQNKFAVPLIAIQSMSLQVGLLYFLTLQIKPTTGERDIPNSIIFIAIYLHFLNCVQELPYSYQLFHHLPEFHEKWTDLVPLGTVLISDAFMIPLMSFVLGALYLCTSRTIGDAILNAVAVAFIREIDNWILSLNAHTDLLSGKVKSSVVHIPVNRAIMRQIAWGIIFVPVVPVLSAAGMCYIGFNVLGL